MTLDRVASRATFARGLAGEAAGGRKALVLAPLGAGKTHTLLAIRDRLLSDSVPCAFIDLFTAASTPERLLVALGNAVRPFMPAGAVWALDDLIAEGTTDRRHSPSALLRLLSLLETQTPTERFVWLVDEVTEIRSLAYFPELGRVEEPFAAAVASARGAVVTSSYMGLAADLFGGLSVEPLPALTAEDLESVPSLRSDGEAVASAIEVTQGFAATLLPLVADMRDTRDLERSLAGLMLPGGALELRCRRHYEVLLLRSRGYAVCKRAAEVVAGCGGQRLTDLFPLIGRTPGASRQYLRWLVEVGLLTQIKKRYDFADPILGLWASLYLGRAGSPTDAEVEEAVRRLVATVRNGDATRGDEQRAELPKKRVDRFEEID